MRKVLLGVQRPGLDVGTKGDGCAPHLGDLENNTII